jgi:hypothetical protein
MWQMEWCILETRTIWPHQVALNGDSEVDNEESVLSLIAEDKISRAEQKLF